MKKIIITLALGLFVGITSMFSQSIGLHNDLDADSIPNLVAFNSAQSNTLYIVKGKSSIGDGGLRFYYYNSTSTATVDNENVLSATGMSGVGRYVKLLNDYNYLINKPSALIADYVNSNTTTSGITTFYLTSDKTSTGTALYSNVNYVAPIVNDASKNYTYSWSYNSSTKALTVTVKTNDTGLAGLLNVLLTSVSNVANGTSVSVLVKGN